MVKNCSCFCQGLKCPCVPACPHLYVSLSTLCGNLKKETLSKYWHTSPTLRISISSAPPLYANVAHATGSQLVIRHLGYRWRNEKKKSYLLLQKMPSMSLGIARKSSKNWSGFFLCSRRLTWSTTLNLCCVCFCCFPRKRKYVLCIILYVQTSIKL